MNEIPVFILSGFLGSGKTTLLLRLLDQAKRNNLQAAVLMNELGRMDIDGHLISEQMPGLSLAKLLDGCICCDKKMAEQNTSACTAPIYHMTSTYVVFQ